jgi:hypothetical protein
VVPSQRGARLHSRERREGESGVFRVSDFLYIIEMVMGWCRLAGLFFGGGCLINFHLHK